MIVPSKKLRQFIEMYENRSTLCERVGVDDSLLSRLIKQERGASSTVIEKFCRFTGWGIEEAWELIEGDGET